MFPFFSAKGVLCQFVDVSLGKIFLRKPRKQWLSIPEIFKLEGILHSVSFPEIGGSGDRE